MERINVSESWRIHNCNTQFEMEFSSKVDMEMAYNAMEQAVFSLNKDYLRDYRGLWLQDLHDCCDKSSFNILSALDSDAYEDYIPAMANAVAKAMPNCNFKVYALYDDQQCFWLDSFDFVYENGILIGEESQTDAEIGYVCPQCGCAMFDLDDTPSGDTMICDGCEEEIKVCDLKKVDPKIKEFFIKIK